MAIKDISIWVQSLGDKARSRFRCRKRKGKYEVPSRTVIRNALINGNYSAKKLEKVLDKVFLYFFRFQRRLPTY
ncbi:MAG: hypothetical protein KZQ61_08200, partial [Candidatus Thiodiazotropha sp. (ex Lucinoma aequizonata)]|nr:hypothetical protein [Candidatus Thiodiazotropha sp. (ex Lucinoma aequizonata)]